MTTTNTPKPASEDGLPKLPEPWGHEFINRGNSAVLFHRGKCPIYADPDKIWPVYSSDQMRAICNAGIKYGRRLATAAVGYDRELIAEMLESYLVDGDEAPSAFQGSSIHQQIILLREADNATGKAVTVNRSPAGEGDAENMAQHLIGIAYLIRRNPQGYPRLLADALTLDAAAALIRRLATTEQPGSAVQGEAEIAQIAYDFLYAAGYDMDSTPLNKIKAAAAAAAATPPPAPAAEQGYEAKYATKERLAKPAATVKCDFCGARPGEFHAYDCTALDSNQPEARGVEGETIDRRARQLLAAEYRVRWGDSAAVHVLHGPWSMDMDAAIRAIAAALRGSLATPNPVRAEQPEAQGTWKLVPVTPTDFMVHVGNTQWADPARRSRSTAADVYHAMLAAAPAPGVRVGGFMHDGTVFTPIPTTHCSDGRVENIDGFMRCTKCKVSFGPAALAGKDGA